VGRTVEIGREQIEKHTASMEKLAAESGPFVLTPAPPVPTGGHPRFFELLDEMKTLHASKGHDYSKTTDPLSNLRRSEAFGIDAWRGVLVRMSDKWSRIEELTNGKTAKHESLRDSLFDLSAYALLCLILLEEKGEK
jgi:hypothetical protein